MASEHKQAQAWREARQLSRDDLARLSGYSAIAIYWFETGKVPPARNHKSGSASRAIKPAVWKRYRNACAGVEYQLQQRQPFGW